MIIYSTLVAMAAVGTSPMPVFFALIIFNQPEVVLYSRNPTIYPCIPWVESDFETIMYVHSVLSHDLT